MADAATVPSSAADVTNEGRQQPAERPAALSHGQRPTPATGMSTTYRGGPISWLLLRLDALPERGWAVIALLALALAAWGNGVLWATGELPVGTIDANVIIVAVYAPYGLAMLMLGRHIALRALDGFWPATGWPDSDRQVWAYQFERTPARIELVAVILGLIGGLAALIAAPTTVVAAGYDTLDYYLANIPLFAAGYTVTTVVTFISARWLLLVMRIHREATEVDVFDRAPLYAFSRLTVFAALGVVAAVYYTLTFNAAYQVGNVPSLAFLGVAFLIGLAAFVVPLWGIHVRIVREKEALLRDVERRVNSIANELYRDIDSGSMDTASKFTALLTSLGSLRERIEHLPTWPWPPNLFRGFITALLLPIAIFILTRVISTYLTQG